MVASLDQHPPSGPYSGLTYRSAKRFMEKQFAEAGLSFAEEDALELLLGLTGLSRTDYVLKGQDFIASDVLQSLQIAVERRLQGEPVDRILGWREFYGRRFAIDHVLSPRGDTEVLLLSALRALETVSDPSILDLGTGSGALAVSVLCERQDAKALATDKHLTALQTARQNADSLGVSTRFDTLLSDWYDAVPSQTFDAILSNPPYIDEQAMLSLEREVARFDPHDALSGGSDGLDPYRIIIPGARRFLKPDGWLGVEIGFDQKDAVTSLFEQAGFVSITCYPDPAGLDRVVEGRLPSS